MALAEHRPDPMEMTGDGRLAVVAAGGTGGHMFPAQALAEELLRRGWRVALATDTRGLRYSGGFPGAVEKRALRAGTPSRGGLLGKLKAPIALLRGTMEATGWFKTDRPSIVIGFGGYPAAPAMAAAIRLGIPRMIHEQNAVLGRANRLFASSADLVVCGLGEPSNAPAGTVLRELGNPIRDTAMAVSGRPYIPPESGGAFRLLVFGGSQGAGKFSEVVPGALGLLSPETADRLQVTQQVREEHLVEARLRFETAGIDAETAPFFTDLPERIADAHLVIARAGASTCAELAAIGRPAILVPLPSATADHQTANARTLEQAGGALLAPEIAFTPESLAANLTELMAAPETLAKMASAAQSLGRPDAGEALADLVEETAKPRD